MEIKAKCKYDLESIRALTHLSTFKKSNPKTRIIFYNIITSALLSIVVLEFAFFGADVTLYLLLCAVLFLGFLENFLYFILPRISFKKMRTFKNVENEFVFCDDMLKVVSKTKEYSGEGQIEYTALVKAYETSRYFFLLQTERQTYIIDKSTIENGTVEDIRNKLISKIEKYIICKY